jgi:hypothetical protein
MKHEEGICPVYIKQEKGRVYTCGRVGNNQAVVSTLAFHVIIYLCDEHVTLMNTDPTSVMTTFDQYFTKH